MNAIVRGCWVGFSAGLSTAWRQLVIAALATALRWTAAVAAGTTDLLRVNDADFAPPPIDAAFTNGLAAVKAASGFRELQTDAAFPDWRTNLCLLLGFRVDNEAKRFVRLVELTALPPPLVNAPGKASRPADAKFECTVDASSSCPTSRVYCFSSPRYPVRVRVFSGEGRLLAESQATLAWKFLTNGLVDACRLSKATRSLPGAAPDSAAADPAGGTPDAASPNADNPTTQLAGEESIMRGLAALVALFGDALGCDALKELRDRAVVVVRPPNLLKIVFSLGLNLNLAPHFDRATLLPARAEAPNQLRVLFPADLSQGKRLLTTVELVASSTEGPYFLTAGVRAIRVVHPLKPERRLLAQVLAAGVIDAKPDPAAQPGRR